MSAQQVEQLLTDAGGLEDSIEEILEVSTRPGQAWVVNWGGKLIFVEYQQLARLLCLRAPIAIPAIDSKEEFFAMLLRYNVMWVETGGLTMALDEDGTDAHLMMPLGFSDLHVSEFVRLLGVFVDRAEQWHEVFS